MRFQAKTLCMGAIFLASCDFGGDDGGGSGTPIPSSLTWISTSLDQWILPPPENGGEP